MMGLLYGLWNQTKSEMPNPPLSIDPPEINCGCPACLRYLELVRTCPLRMAAHRCPHGATEDEVCPECLHAPSDDPDSASPVTTENK